MRFRSYRKRHGGFFSISAADFLRWDIPEDPTLAEWLVLPHVKRLEKRLGFNFKAAAKTECVVYFIKAKGLPEVKIGTTKRARLPLRLSELRCGNARELRVTALLPGGSDVEARLHKRFESVHVNGEWFLPGPDMLGVIKAANYVYGFCMSCARIHFRPLKVDAADIECISHGFILDTQPEDVWV